MRQLNRKKQYIFIVLAIAVVCILGMLLYYFITKKPPSTVASAKKNVNIETLTDLYNVYEEEGVFTKEECGRVIAYMRSRMKRSTVAGKTDRDVSKDRTSKTGWVKYDEKEMEFFTNKLKALGKKLSGVQDDEMYEDVSIVQYEPGQLYKPHYDACTTEKYCKKSMRIYRVATIIVYLNDNFLGGETNFPKAHKKVKPKTGKIAFFKNSDDRGVEIHEALHEGMEVKEGNKWIATLWIKFKPSPGDIKFLNNYK